MSVDDELRVENEALRSRIAAADAELDALRTEALARRAEVRALAESLPLVASRRAILGEMVREARHHPDKRGVARRAVAKLWRGVRKAGRGARRIGRLPQRIERVARSRP